MERVRILLGTLLLLLACFDGVSANYPLFDESTKMRVLLVPSDARVGSAIYRLRATDSDYDYPLEFEILGRTGKDLLRVETLPCARNHTACEANVYLARALERGRIYYFRMSVRDSRGDATNVEASLRATNGSAVSALDTAFPRYSTLVMVPENAKAGTELEYIMVRKNYQHSRHAYLELSGSPLFSMKQRLAGPDISNGTIILNGPLDFEKQNLYSMQVHATDPYVSAGVDTRNILGFELAIVVTDVQDTPPVFILAPPVTPLAARAQPGDLVLQVQAEDGDKGQPRDIRYGLLTEGNPFTPFFSIDENSGEVRLTRSLSELRAISRPGQPVMLRVLAEEVATSGVPEAPEASHSAVAELALLLPGSANTAPYFEAESYVASVPEGSAPGTPLIFTDPWMPRVRDNDMGLGAVFALSLQDDNGTFEISPTVAEGSANFVVRVKNNAMLDYERYHSLTFKVVAREVSQAGPAALSGSASVIVLLTDINDSAPRFQKPLYTASLPENITAGTLVAQVHADDVDTGVFGRVRYTRLLGQMNGSLSLDPETGQITVATNNHGFDREEAPEYRLYVEVRDEEGEGKAATVPLVITLIDVNDHAPTFEYDTYELFLGPENKNFSTKVFLKAIDADAESPNNEVRYEIMSGNVGDKFLLNEITGELMVRQVKEKRIGKRELDQRPKEPSLYILNVRAYDLGVPHRWSRAEVRIHSADIDGPTMGSVVFIVPRSPASVLADPRRTERFLAQLTGGRVAIREVRPYRPGDPELGAADLASGAGDADKSVVVALVTYTGEPAVVDVAQMQQRLMANQTATTITREVVTEYRAESSAIFWFLVFLALLLALAILALVICFFHSGCPLYFSRKERRTPRSAEEVRLVLERAPRDDEDKLALRREAWSAEGGRRYFHFNRRNILTLDHRPTLEEGRGVAGGVAGGVAPGDAQPLAGQSHHENVAPGPSVIYTREMQQRHRKRDVFLEDVESEYPSTRKVNFNARESTRSLPSMLQTNPNIVCIKDREGNKIFVHQEESADEIDSMRRHEMERGSDLGQVRYLMRERSAQTTQNEPEVVEVLTLDEEEATGREQHYVKAGNAEVLRLVTRSRPDENGYRQSRARRVNQTDAGKDIIMRRFMEDQRQHNQNGGEGDSSQISLPGQILLQTGTQTDEERGTQTENESVNTPPNINDSPLHEKHVIKTPIIEENESSLEHVNNVNTLSKNSREEKSNAEVLKFQRVVEEAYERGKSETEFNYGDTKSSMLRRQLNYEKAGMDGSSSDERRKQRMEKESNVTRDKESKPSNTHRSQSLPRNSSERKRRSSVTEVQKPLRQKSSSINSGLDKASRVTFATPDHSLSDDEIFAMNTIKKKSMQSVSGTSSLRASNNSLNKSASSTPKHRKIRGESISDDENLVSFKNSKIRRSTSSLRASNSSLNKSTSSALKSRKTRKDSLSDGENDSSNRIAKSTKSVKNSLRTSNTSLKSVSPAPKIRKSREDVSDEEQNTKDIKSKKSATSLRSGKVSSKKSDSPAPKNHKRKDDISDDDDEKPTKSSRPRAGSRNSISVSPAPKLRRPRREEDSDEEVRAPKLKPSKNTANVKPQDVAVKRTRTSTTLTRNKSRNENDSEGEMKSSSVTKTKSNNVRGENNNLQNTSRPVRSKTQYKHNTDTSDKNQVLAKSSSMHSSKTSLNKAKPMAVNHYPKDNQNDSDIESDAEITPNMKSTNNISNSQILKSKLPKNEVTQIVVDSDHDEENEHDSTNTSQGGLTSLNTSNSSIQQRLEGQQNESRKASLTNGNRYFEENLSSRENLRRDVNSKKKTAIQKSPSVDDTLSNELHSKNAERDSVNSSQSNNKDTRIVDSKDKRAMDKENRFMEKHDKNKSSRETDKKSISNSKSNQHSSIIISSLSDNIQSTVINGVPYEMVAPIHSSTMDENQDTLVPMSVGEGRLRDTVHQDMQTDVSLVPLINSIGMGRGRDDDLDSGIAMSQLASDGRSRRLNQLIEKKSIFTIAYDDMQTKQLRADSASPQY